MTKVDEYVATRVELIKGKYTDNEKPLRRQCAKLWDALTDAEKRDAETRYLAETAPLLKERR